MNLNHIKLLYVLADDFIHLAYHLLHEQDFLFESFNVDLMNKITYENITRENVLNMLNVILNFKHMYEREYNIIKIIY